VKPRPARVSAGQIGELASKLTDRDRRIAHDCYEHRVLTTDQLRRLHFRRARTTRRRLGQLHQLRVLDRFRPAWQRGEGSPPYHWVLDEVGAYLVADELGIDRRELRWRHADAISIAASAKLVHQRAVNDLFTQLAVEAHEAGGALSEWYGERTTRTLLGGTVVPDGYGVLELSDHPPLHVLVELDRGSETHERLREKAAAYERALPRSPLRDLRPIVLLAATRGRVKALAREGDLHPLVPVIWSPTEPVPLVPAVLDCVGEPRLQQLPRSQGSCAGNAM
jgi:hypothetical protein